MNAHGLLVFDLDGTLYRTESSLVPAVREVLDAAGVEVPSTRAVLSFVGMPAEEFDAWIRSLCPRGTETDIQAAITLREREMVSTKGELYAGVVETLSALRDAGNNLAICTNGRQEYVECVIEAHGLGELFDEVRYRRSDVDRKPDMVRELLGLLNGRPAVVIGDRREDVEAAHRNGLWAVAATYGYGSPAELRSADAHIASITDLPEILAA